MLKSILAMSLVPFLALAADKPDLTNLNAVRDFVTKNMIGRTLKTHLVGPIAGGTIQSDFTRETKFSNLNSGAMGFSFDAMITIQQTLQDVLEEGKLGEKRKQDRAFVFRYTASHKSSTGEVFISTETLSSTREDMMYATPGLMRAKLEGEKLFFERLQSGYNDCFGKGGTWFPCTIQGTMFYEIVNGKLHRHDENYGAKVDPVTLVATRIVDKPEVIDETEE